MASSLFTLSLLLAGVLTVTANYPCCDEFQSHLESGTMCSMTGCQNASDFNSHQAMVEFMDTCRLFKGLNTTIQIAQCFARQMPRSLYHAFATEENGNGPVNQEKANIASLVMAYGCFRTASSQTCRIGLEKAIFVDHRHAILGITPANFSAGPVHAKLSLNSLIGPCISPPGTFNNSEFDNGMAECAAVGGYGSISGHAITGIPIDGQQCYPCSPYSTTEQPFCAAFFLPGRFGARCHSPRLVDRVAQTYYSRWNRTGRVHVGDIRFDLPRSDACHNLVKEMACRATIGECESRSIRTVCTTTCQNRLLDDCQVSSTVAAPICQAIGATGTSSTCPPARPTTATETTLGTTDTPAAATTAAAAAPQLPQPHYTLRVTSDSPNGREFNISICLTERPAGSVQVLILAALSTDAVIREVGENTIITGFRNVSDNECALRAIVTIMALSESQDGDSSPPTQATATTAANSVMNRVSQTASRALGLAPESVTVASQNIRIPILVEQIAGTSDNGSGQSTVSAAVALVMAALCAAFYLH